MSAFSALDMINPKARQQAAAVREYKEIYLNPKEVKEAPENTRKTYEGIEALADSFLLVGQEQPTVLARVNGEFLIVDGHRRNRANLLNLERGYTKFEKVRYFFRDMSETMYELALLSGNGYTQGLTDYEKTELAARLKKVLEKMRENGEISKEGRIRDIVGGILGEKGDFEEQLKAAVEALKAAGAYINGVGAESYETDTGYWLVPIDIEFLKE